MAASDALHPMEFQHHKSASAPVSVPPTSAPSQSHPELVDGSGYNAANMWSYTASAEAASKSAPSQANQD